MTFSAWLIVGYGLIQLALRQGLGDLEILAAVGRLTLVLTLVNTGVALAFNPWRRDHASDRFPAIVQDVLVLVLFAVIGTVILREQLLTTSAVGAVVVGFALQDTLGNFIAGVAIQIERPFRVGQWVQFGDREGQVQEITWRATKLRTKAGQFLIVPNNLIAKDPVLNFSEPTIPTRVDVEVPASCNTPPNEVKHAILEAISNSPHAMKAPPPQVTISGFGASSVDYLAQFWIEDYAVDRVAKDQVRTNVWYGFRRRGIEIPYPIQIQYDRTEEPIKTERHVLEAAAKLGEIDLFKTLSDEARYALANAAHHHLFAGGEPIVRQDADGDSMFLLLAGRVRVVLEPSGQEVAVIPEGGFFGEMSLLTGDRRTATVKAIEDVRVLEITAAEFRGLAVANPALLEHVSDVVTKRRVGLDDAKTAAAALAAPQAKENFLARIRRFLTLPT